ncbi:MAG: hypothetical protein K1X57_10550 [Gemmataceae bacterium]|nr:hypothetical protein [Gemmataceae bacterium]
MVIETMTAPTADQPRRRPMLVKRRGAANVTGFSLPTWDRMSAAGLNPAGFKVGGARVYRVEELEAWVRAECPPRDVWAARWAAIEKNASY